MNDGPRSTQPPGSRVTLPSPTGFPRGFGQRFPAGWSGGRALKLALMNIPRFC